MLAINAWITRHPAWFERSRIEIEDGREGWRQLIDDAFTSAEKIVSDCPGAFIEITQVKEKLGALTIYFRQEGLPSEASIRLREIMHAARARSLHVCEICGAQAHLGALDSCLSVRCPLCAPAGWALTEIVEYKQHIGQPLALFACAVGRSKTYFSGFCSLLFFSSATNCGEVSSEKIGLTWGSPCSRSRS